MEHFLQQEPTETQNEFGNAQAKAEEEDKEEEVEVGLLERRSKSSKEPRNLPISAADLSSTLESAASGYSGTNGTSDRHRAKEEHGGVNGSAEEPTLQLDGDRSRGPLHDESHISVYFDEEQGVGLNGHSVAQPENVDGGVVSSDFLDDLIPETFPQASETLTDDSHSISNGISQAEATRDQAREDVDVIEELDKELAESDVERVIEKQETHDLFCPNCHSCITKRVILKRRKRKVHEPPSESKREKLEIVEQAEPEAYATHTSRDVATDNLLSNDGAPAASDRDSEREPCYFRCLSCFSIFFPTGNGLKLLRASKGVKETGESLTSEANNTANTNWFLALFKSNNKTPAMEEGQTGPIPSQINSAYHPNLSSDAKAIPHVKDVALLQDHGETSFHKPDSVHVACGDETSNKVSSDISRVSVSTGVAVEAASLKQTQMNKEPDVATEDKQRFTNINRTPDASVGDDEQTAQNGEYSSTKQGSLTPIQPSYGITVVSKVTVDSNEVRIDAGVPWKADPLLLDEPKLNSEKKSDDSTSNLFSGDGVMVTIDPGTGPRLDQSAGSAFPGEPDDLLQSTTRVQVHERPHGAAAEGHRLEILKSIVYGGLIESITSLSVVLSAAGTGASILNIFVLGIANLIGGLVVVFHNLRELISDEAGETATTQQNVRYREMLGRRENFRLHAFVVILSFLIFGLVPPVVYGFSFPETNNRDYKGSAVLVSSLICILLLSLAKAHVKSPPSGYVRTALYYLTIGVASSGVSYIMGEVVGNLLRDLHWFDQTGPASMAGQLVGGRVTESGWSSF